MGWKQINGNRYYYRSRRVGNRVISEYRGYGLYADLAALEDQIDAENRKTEREAWKAEVNRFRRQDQEINDTLTLIDKLTFSALLLAGYHQHNRQWRRRRGRRIDNQTN